MQDSTHSKQQLFLLSLYPSMSQDRWTNPGQLQSPEVAADISVVIFLWPHLIKHTCKTGLATLLAANARTSFPLSSALRTSTKRRARWRNAVGARWVDASFSFPLPSTKRDFMGPCFVFQAALFFERKAGRALSFEKERRRSKLRMT
jgi:hypothetical protein